MLQPTINWLTCQQKLLGLYQVSNHSPSAHLEGEYQNDERKVSKESCLIKEDKAQKVEEELV